MFVQNVINLSAAVHESRVNR